MAITKYDWWYDGQIERFLEQLVRAFSGFQYQTGGLNPQTLLVPCTMATTDRQVAAIMRNLSENTLLSVPKITIHITGLTGRRDAVQNPDHIDTLKVVERDIDPLTGFYTGNKGNSYNVERIMPKPFTLNLNVDIWTSNQLQKLQLLEQILSIIYPTFDIQNSENALDWTALTTVQTEDIIYSSRAIPVGTESEIDIATISLRLDIWLSPPAKVKRQNIIQQIVANVFAGTVVDEQNGIIDGKRMLQDIITPGDHLITVNNNVITLLGEHGDTHLADGSLPSWSDLFSLYGTFKPAQSKIHLITGNDIEGSYVAGTMQLDSNNPNQIFWQVDPNTLPTNTLSAVDAVIEPLRTGPGLGLPNVADGQRYLVLEDVGPSSIWGNLNARENDIIEYSNGSWSISFDASTVTTDQYVLNLFTNRQLYWNGKEWVVAIDKTYLPGYWRLDI